MEFVKVKDFAEVITGGTPSTRKDEYWIDGSVPWLNSGELQQDIVTTTSNYITELGLEKSAAKLMPEDSVLIALTGTTTGKVGYLTFEACANQSVTGILPSEKHIPKYLYHFLNFIRPKVVADAYGGAQPHISQGYVKDLRIPLPSLAEQERIAALLDAADALRAKDKSLITTYDQLTQSLFLEMFGDPVTNPKGWEKVELGTLGKWQSGGTPSRKIPEYFEGNIPWLSSGELNHMYVKDTVEKISEEALANSGAKLIPKGSLLLGMYDTAALKSTISSVQCTCNQAIVFSKLNSTMANTVYVYFCIQYAKEHYKSLQRGVRQKNLNLSIVKGLKLNLPTIELQNEFAERVGEIEGQKALATQNAQKSEELFQALLQKAFKGEL